MHRIFASLFSEETIIFPENNEEPDNTKNEDQIEAVRDLHATYAHPVKCSYQTNSKKKSEWKNSISILRQREIGLINFRRYPNARYRLLNRYLYYKS